MRLTFTAGVSVNVAIMLVVQLSMKSMQVTPEWILTQYHHGSFAMWRKYMEFRLFVH